MLDIMKNLSSRDHSRAKTQAWFWIVVEQLYVLVES